MGSDVSDLNRPDRRPSGRELDELLAQLLVRQAQHDERAATLRYTYRLPKPATPVSTSAEAFGTLSDVERRQFLRHLATVGGMAFGPGSQMIQSAASGFPTHPGAAAGDSGTAGAVDALWASPVREAVVSPGAFSLGQDPRPVADLRPAVELAFQLDLASRRSTLGISLPALIADAETTVEHGLPQVRDETLSLLADVYSIACWTLIKADDPNVAWIAAERSLDAARRANDSLRMALAYRCLSEAHMRAGRFDVASQTAIRASSALTAVPEAEGLVVNIRGAALLSAAAAAARAQDRHEAHEALSAADACAGQLGSDRTDLGVVFGPTNVAIHRVVVAIELGDAHSARRNAQAVHLENLPTWLGERRSRFLIDLARAEAHLGNDPAAMRSLLLAERAAPEEARCHRLTRTLVKHMLERERRTGTPELRAFAARCGALER